MLSLREIASRVLAHCQHSLPPSVTAEVTGDSPGWTQGNVALLENTLHHLLTNAVEAMPAGGVLTLHVHDEGDLCCLSVRDTGPGVAPEVIAHLFEPFVTTKASGHLGLGLALCRDMVQVQRGRLQVASLAGQGATVTLSFPALRNDGARATST